jgi:hypothetical protein
MNARSTIDPVARWRAAFDRTAANDRIASRRAEAFERFAGARFPGRA